MCPELRDNPSTIDFLNRHISLQDLKFQALAGDASARRYVRIYNSNASYILMIFPKKEKTMGEHFMQIRDLFEQQQVHVPKLLGHDFSLGYILLEDLGDLTLERRFWESQDRLKALPFYIKSINELIKIHRIPIDKNLSYPCFHMEFDTEKLLWEMNYMRKNLLLQFFELDLSADFEQNLVSDFESICNHLSSLPQVVCHRDYHSRNIMLHKNETYVIDFQDARLGPKQYDLVSLLRDSYVTLPSEIELELLQYYFDRTSDLYPESWEEFYQNYQIQILQRTLKACGSFSSFYNAKKDTRYLKYIQPTLKNVETLLATLEGYEALKELFTTHKISERSCKI
ncbi:MAG: phosphotransferase [Bdellovibrionaceae bacterium]|nr:phosphotransferase [Pseudobdellovibrionaceae bacterium]